jgi:hypothetical protein
MAKVALGQVSPANQSTDCFSLIRIHDLTAIIMPVVASVTVDSIQLLPPLLKNLKRFAGTGCS